MNATCPMCGDGILPEHTECAHCGESLLSISRETTFTHDLLSTLTAAAFLVFTALSGCVIVLAEFVLLTILFVVWLVITSAAVLRMRKHSGNRPAFITATLHATLMAAIITAAALAPVKHLDIVLTKRVHLDSTTTTVAELAEYCRAHRKSLPLLIHLPDNGPAAQSPLRFSSNDMTLKQFIGEVEEQTGCRHSFAGCGNAYTILYGGTYGFGLSFALQPGTGLKWD